MDSVEFKLIVAILYACGAIFGCRAIIKQIQQSFRQGYWRGRTGVAYRATSPKTFWVAMMGLVFLMVLFIATTCILFITPFVTRD